MKGIRKINRGFVLFLVVLAVLIAYLVILNMWQNSQKAKIKEVCMQATDIFSQCITIPEELYMSSNTYSDEAFNQYEEECYNHFASICADTSTVNSIVKYALDIQLENGNYITKFGNAYIQEIDYNFKGNTVSVSIYTDLNYKTVYADMIESGTLIAYPNFTFELKKEDGEWKLLAFDPNISAYLDCYNSNYYYYGGY